jgi:hypothetical protein
VSTLSITCKLLTRLGVIGVSAPVLLPRAIEQLSPPLGRRDCVGQFFAPYQPLLKILCGSGACVCMPTTAEISLNSGDEFVPLYTFTCSKNHDTDKIVPYDTKTTKCSVCGAKAKRSTAPALVARRDPNLGIQK